VSLKQEKRKDKKIKKKEQDSISNDPLVYPMSPQFWYQNSLLLTIFFLVSTSICPLSHAIYSQVKMKYKIHPRFLQNEKKYIYIYIKIKTPVKLPQSRAHIS